MDQTVMITLIGVGGGIVGAGIGGTASLAVATLSRKHQRQDREDLRWAEERLANYLRFLSEAADLERRMEMSANSDPKPPPGPAPSSETAALMAAFDEMRLIAPRDVVDLASRYSFALRVSLHAALVQAATAWAAKPPDSTWAQKAQKHLDNVRSELGQLERDLRRVIRENLGTASKHDLPKAGHKSSGQPSGVESLFYVRPSLPLPKHPGSPSEDDPRFTPGPPKHPGPPGSRRGPWSRWM